MSWTSRRRTTWLLIRYEELPSRVSTRLTEISANCPQLPPMRPRLLSKMSSTEARAAGLRSAEPLKMTSCMDSPRSSEALDSPSTQRTASMMLDLPQPLGPTTPTSGPGTSNAVGSTNDLKPASLICLSRKLRFPPGKARAGATYDIGSPSNIEKPRGRLDEWRRRRLDEGPAATTWRSAATAARSGLRIIASPPQHPRPVDRSNRAAAPRARGPAGHPA